MRMVSGGAVGRWLPVVAGRWSAVGGRRTPSIQVFEVEQNRVMLTTV